MRKLYSRGVAAATLAVVATAGGAMAVSAATSTPSPTPAASSARHLHKGIFELPKVVGEVVSVSTEGGLLGHGTLVVQEPDGDQVTLNLTARTKAYLYHGVGVKPTAETVSSLAKDEVVLVAGWGVNGKRHLAIRILDLGFQAATTTS